MKSFKRMALGVSAGTLALAGFGIAGASGASADSTSDVIPGYGGCATWDYHSGGVGSGWVSANTHGNWGGCDIQVYAKCSDGSWVAGDVNYGNYNQVDMYAWCGGGSVVSHWGFEVKYPSGTWQAFQKA